MNGFMPPFGLNFLPVLPRLTPWAITFRSFGAGLWAQKSVRVLCAVRVGLGLSLYSKLELSWGMSDLSNSVN